MFWHPYPRGDRSKSRGHGGAPCPPIDAQCPGIPSPPGRNPDQSRHRRRKIEDQMRGLAKGLEKDSEVAAALGRRASGRLDCPRCPSAATSPWIWRGLSVGAMDRT